LHSTSPPPLPEPPDLEAPVRVVAGPDLDRFAPGALETLTGSAYVISPRSDRVGVRLVGPRLARVGDDAGLSAPMLPGAIQLPAAGEPIVLGPDGPTTGGYPVLAVVAAAGLGAVMARPVGCVLRFALG
jgi:allophanate hydrolase subunit 2